jgi:uncharacterized protein (TIGR04255 family)
VALHPVSSSERVFFARPPVAEVALAAYFSPPLALRTPHVGMLWERWRDQFPRFEDHSVLPPVVPETFTPSTLSMQLVTGPDGIRTWFVSEEGDRLIQVQADRLVLNWRKTPTRQDYPSYDDLRPAFVEALTTFLDFAALHRLGAGMIQQAEVTYTNPIAIEDLGDPPDPRRLVAPWSGTNSDNFLPAPEELQLAARYVIPNPSSGAPAGRLYIQGSPALQPSAQTGMKRIYMLQLFARGAPLGEGLDATMSFLDLAHSWVVRGFRSFTAEPMHTVWGLQEEPT